MSRRIQLEREKRQLTQVRPCCGGAAATCAHAPRLQAAYASHVLSESQFAELEALQTPDSMNFVAEGAALSQSAPRSQVVAWAHRAPARAAQ